MQYETGWRVWRDFLVFVLGVVVVTTIAQGGDLCWLLFWAGGGC